MLLLVCCDGKCSGLTHTAAGGAISHLQAATTGKQGDIRFRRIGHLIEHYSMHDVVRAPWMADAMESPANR